MKILALVFLEGLRRTKFAVSGNDSRFAINGILMLVECGELKMVSTDGVRLCLYKMMLASKDMLDMSLLIPIKAMRGLIEVISGELKLDKKAEVLIKKGSQLEFVVGHKLMMVREFLDIFPTGRGLFPITLRLLRK